MSPEAAGWRRAGARAQRSAPATESAGLRRRKVHEHVRAARRQDPGAACDRTRSYWLSHSPRFYLLVQLVDPTVLEVLVGDEQPVLEGVGERLARRQLAEHLAHLLHPEPIDEILGGRIAFQISDDRLLGCKDHPTVLQIAQVDQCHLAADEFGDV